MVCFSLVPSRYVWGVIATFLGIKLPMWMGIQRYRLLWTVVLVPLVFAAPVVDEVIAYPQMKALCKTVEHVEFDQRLQRDKPLANTRQ